MMQARQHVDQFGKVAKILNRGIAAAFIEIADEGWTIDWRKNRIVAADHHIVGGVAGELYIFAWRCLDQ